MVSRFKASFYPAPEGAPFESVYLVWDEAGLHAIEFVENDRPELHESAESDSRIKVVPSSPYDETLTAYFAGESQDLDVPLVLKGTDFQQQVWRAMQTIPYGQTMSYKEIAEQVGRPKAYRAVANACGANNLPIVIPCHRVVGTGNIGGYSSGLAKKRWLFAIEKTPLSF